MIKHFLLFITVVTSFIALPALADKLDKDQQVDPEWSENPYGEEEGNDADNPESTGEINRKKDDDDLNDVEPDEIDLESDPSGLEEATEQGIGQQY